MQYGFNAYRTAQRTGVYGDADIIVEELPELHIEVKVGKNPPIAAGMVQAIRDVGDSGKIPIVQSHKDRGDWLITMRFDDFMPILHEAFFEGVDEATLLSLGISLEETTEEPDPQS